jgi:hypothetical protein
VGLVLCLSCFALTYGLAMFLGGLVNILVFGVLEPDFGGAAGNIRALGYFLPILSALMTLSAFVGARKYQLWLQLRWKVAAGVGSAAGILTAVAFLSSYGVVELARRVLPSWIGVVIFLFLRFSIFVIPAIVTRVVTRSVHRKAEHGHTA